MTNLSKRKSLNRYYEKNKEKIRIENRIDYYYRMIKKLKKELSEIQGGAN